MFYRYTGPEMHFIATEAEADTTIKSLNDNRNVSFVEFDDLFEYVSPDKLRDRFENDDLGETSASTCEMIKSAIS